MDMPYLPEPYQSLVDNGQFSSCRKLLEQEGLNWLFNLQIPQIMLFLPIMGQLLAEDQVSLRLTLIQNAVNPECNADEMFGLLDMLKQEQDQDGVTACVILALGAIWEESNDFTKFAPWLDEAESLLASGQLSVLARAALLLQCCWSEVAWQSDLAKVIAGIPKILTLAEQARSPSITLMCSALGVYVHGWRGDLAAAELLLIDAEPYLSSAQVSPLAAQQYSNSKGLLLTLQGDVESAKMIFTRLLKDELLNFVPNSVWLLIHANYLHCLVACGDKVGAERLNNIITERTVPEQKWYYHSYLHFNLAIAELAAGRPYKTLLHAEEASRRGELCYSVNAVRMPALLQGQALVDLEQDNEAMELFAEWLPKWEQAEFYLIAAQAYFEMAVVYVRKGEYNAARDCLDKAVSLTPLNERVPVVYRRENFQDRLRRSVNMLRYKKLRLQSPVFIQCLGGFSIIAHGTKVDFSVLKGRRSVALLKTIISTGCTGIPVGQIADVLWPDADGDKAIGAFKVALSRLRGSLREICPEINLIQVKDGLVSLDMNVCTLDCNLFEMRAEKVCISKTVDETKISDVMGMYTGAYLPEEVEEPCHVNRRNKLQRLYVQLGILLAEKYKLMGRRDKVIECLEDVLEHGVVSEQVYQLLIESYITHGNNTKAMELFAQAEKKLFDVYGVAPGEKLTQLASRIKC